jgi:hypothetical protein
MPVIGSSHNNRVDHPVVKDSPQVGNGSRGIDAKRFGSGKPSSLINIADVRKLDAGRFLKVCRIVDTAAATANQSNNEAFTGWLRGTCSMTDQACSDSHRRCGAFEKLTAIIAITHRLPFFCFDRGLFT